MSDWSHPAPSALDDKLSWVQPVTTNRVAEGLGCCSRAHSISGAVTVLAAVQNTVCKMSWGQTEPLEKICLEPCFTSCLEWSGICFCLEDFASQTSLLNPLQGPAPCWQAPGAAERAAFRTEVFQYQLSTQNLRCKSQAWLQLARGKMSYNFSNDLELNTISLTKVIMQTGFSFSLKWFVKPPYGNQFERIVESYIW